MSNSQLHYVAQTLTSLKIGVASNRLSFELIDVELQGVRVAESIDHHAN